jgi:hypothetical protein
MAITRAQQAKQMLQNGGMLVQPGFGGTRQGYRGDDAYGGSEASKGDGPETGADSLGDLNREARMGDKGKTRSGKADKGEGLSNVITPTNIIKGLISLKTKVPTFGINLFNTKKGIKDPNVYEQAKLDFFTDDDDDTVEPGGEGEYIPPTFAQTQIAPGTVAPVMPMQRPMDLNRIAYRFFADGGFLEDTDEERQAYGLGSFVKKITRPIKKAAKATVKRVKKVAKSPIGRLAIAVAAPYALGPAFGTGVMGSLSAAQKAALISGATTGITQLASGEDLDFKDIALSAALSGATAKAFPPGGAPKADPTGIAGRARVASDISAGAIPDRAMGQITPRFFDADDVVLATQKPNLISSQIQKGIIPDRGMGQIFERAVPKDTSIFQKGKNIFKAAKDSKALDFIKENPLLTILGTSALAGITAKKQQEEPEEFRDEDRGPSLDIEGITARPFDTLRSRFAGSEFDFYAADGGRIGYDDAGAVLSKEQIKKVLKNPLFKGFKTMYSVDPNMARENEAYKDKFDIFEQVYKQKFQEGGKAEPVAKKVMPLLDMGGMEKDYREDGGFVPIGRMEKADDVPARLSKNEFVFTADAVRNAGDGDVDKGAEVMYNMMKNLEAGGDVSEESQGLEGARKMFQTSQRLEEVL